MPVLHSSPPSQNTARLLTSSFCLSSKNNDRSTTKKGIKISFSGMAASHPPYSEMILAAISELGAKEGSNKTKISRQIFGKYGYTLKQNHYEELSAALDRMQANGQLVFYKNNYMKPDPNAPPRRGRGRPLKEKVSGTEAAGSSTPKGTESSVPAGGKEPGLPSKTKEYGNVASPSSLAGTNSCSGTPQSGVKRGRGRPPKAKVSGTEWAGSSAPKGTESSGSAGGKEHNMPPKTKEYGNVASPSLLAGINFCSETPLAGVKRGRGRPPKATVSGIEGPGSSAPKGTKSPVSAVGKETSMPPKAQEYGNVASPSSLAGTNFCSEMPQAGVKRGRGRPPKVKPLGADVAGM